MLVRLTEPPQVWNDNIGVLGQNRRKRVVMVRSPGQPCNRTTGFPEPIRSYAIRNPSAGAEYFITPLLWHIRSACFVQLGPQQTGSTAQTSHQALLPYGACDASPKTNVRLNQRTSIILWCWSSGRAAVSILGADGRYLRPIDVRLA